jgi:hypothetical protein
MVTDTKYDVKHFVSDLLKRENLIVPKGCQTLRVHSHCAGIDAPMWGLRLLGVPVRLLLASEIDPVPALVHLLHHGAVHLFADVADAAAGTGLHRPSTTRSQLAPKWLSEEWSRERRFDSRCGPRTVVLVPPLAPPERADPLEPPRLELLSGVPRWHLGAGGLPTAASPSYPPRRSRWSLAVGAPCAPAS